MTFTLDIRAAGIIVYRCLRGELQYLLLQANKHKRHWTPPKGRVDPGEVELQTAFRETEEESGIRKDQLNVIEDFSRELHYNVSDGRHKRVIYWLAELKQPETPITISNEHLVYKWYNTEEALKILQSFPDMQTILREADAFIRNMK